MSEVKVYKKRESIIYAGFKPEGAPDFYEVEYVLKSDYDALKNKLAQYESGDLPTWKSEHDIIKDVCDSLDKSNQELLSENIKLKTLINNPKIEDWYLKVENLRRSNAALRGVIKRMKKGSK